MSRVGNSTVISIITNTTLENRCISESVVYTEIVQRKDNLYWNICVDMSGIGLAYKIKLNISKTFKAASAKQKYQQNRETCSCLL